MTKYLTLDEALYIHKTLIASSGGSDGVRDLGLIEAALLRPQTGYYGDLTEEAAALWESLAMNHGFVDGNKPVAYACLEIFLGINGVEVAADNDTLQRFILGHLEAGMFIKDVLDEWLRAHIQPTG